MARVKLKDGRSGDLLHIHNCIAVINVDTTSDNPGGTIQVHESEIVETASGAERTGDIPFIPPVTPPPVPVEDPGVMALAGSAELLKPVFIHALIQALQHPSVVDCLTQAIVRTNISEAEKMLNGHGDLGNLFNRTFQQLRDTLQSKPPAVVKSLAPKKKIARKPKGK